MKEENLEKRLLDEKDIKLSLKKKPRDGDLGLFYVFVGRSGKEVGISFGETEWLDEKPLFPMSLDRFPTDLRVGSSGNELFGKKFHCWTPQIPSGAEPVIGGSYVMLQPNLLMVNSTRSSVPQEVVFKCAKTRNLGVIYRSQNLSDNRSLMKFLNDIASNWPTTDDLQFLPVPEINEQLKEYFRLSNIPSPGSLGKCVLCFDLEKGTLGMAFKEANEIHLDMDFTEYDVNETREYLRQYMANLQDYTDVGFHSHIRTPENWRTISGGAFYVEEDGTCFIDRESGDYGKMHRLLVDSCLRTEGITPAFLDNEYMMTENPVDYLSARVGRDRVTDDLAECVTNLHETFDYDSNPMPEEGFRLE